MAASVALVTNDIKRVLAYSTISQLGYMFLAVGVGAYSAAVFHMVTNAFFKALLFLGAGSVMHGRLHDELDMRRMGGLRRYLPVTAGTFIVAWLAIAGIFPFAGFWSKDAILAQAFDRDRYGLWAVGIVTAALTALYMGRQVYLVFYGNERWRHEATTPRESPAVMTVPMVVLAVLTVVGGLLDLPFRSLDWLTRWLEPVFGEVPEPAPASFMGGASLAAVALGVSLAGITLARRLYRRGLSDRDPLVARLGSAAPVLGRGYGIDAAYAAAVRGPGRRVAGWLADTFETRIVDGTVNGIATAVRATGDRLRRLQSGHVRHYALGMAAGTVLLLLWAMLRAG